MAKNRFVVEVQARANVKSKVIVEAESKEQAEELARQVAFEPFGMTDISGQPIEGIGDLVWEYDELDVEPKNPILAVGKTRKLP